MTSPNQWFWPTPAPRRKYVSPFIDWLYELIDRAEDRGVKIEPLTPEEVEDFVK